jgi:hypothetical protein
MRGRILNAVAGATQTKFGTLIAPFLCTYFYIWSNSVEPIFACLLYRLDMIVHGRERHLPQNWSSSTKSSCEALQEI